MKNKDPKKSKLNEREWGWIALIISLITVSTLPFYVENAFTQGIVWRIVFFVVYIISTPTVAYCLYKEIKRSVNEARQEGIDSVSAPVAENTAEEKKDESAESIKEDISEEK